MYKNVLVGNINTFSRLLFQDTKPSILQIQATESRFVISEPPEEPDSDSCCYKCRHATQAQKAKATFIIVAMSIPFILALSIILIIMADSLNSYYYAIGFEQTLCTVDVSSLLYTSQRFGFVIVM